MRQHNVAGLRCHLDYSQLGVINDLAALHEPLHAFVCPICGTQCLDPWTTPNQRLARIRRSQPLNVFLARQTVHEPMRSCNKKSTAASGSKF